MNMSRDQQQIINPNSVQSQFASLVRDKEILLKQSTNANNERRQEESKLQHLRSMQASLSEKTRIAHASLGLQSSKKQMLSSEIQRLNKVSQQDRQAIEKLTVDVQKVESENLQKKFQFVTEMDGLNEELTDALRMYEEKRIERALTSIRNCKTFEQALRNKLQLPECTHSQEWLDVSLSFTKAIDTLEHCHKNLQSEKSKYSSLYDEVQAMRRQVEMKHQKSLGQMELDELESLWENSSSEVANKSINDVSTVVHHPVNMHLFYGNDLNGLRTTNIPLDGTKNHEEQVDNTQDNHNLLNASGQ